ncbi:hypothetical protein MPDQ_007678 [Monascus purpureus]|uniref:Sister chromatid cohesion protein Dcc1 n=1 Tax=Monascus purpureus TaxID=5098 RepID=A0A507QRL0_MONPU|nr:hypothetical protein MPDQ_007678 [Monascus purpureus]BDD55184.1 hypothetical protein MAP00_000731 [Monascus purpureus]
MSTQAARSIRLTHTSAQQGFRLLELPRELLGILSSDDAPLLELKSTPTAPDENSTEGEQEYINLCTPTQTYRVRQVQSSNSIHVLRPSQGLHGNPTSDGADNNENEEELGLAESVTSIAKCSSTLELHMPREEFSAIPFLLKVLKVYNRLSSDGDVPVHADMDVDVGMGMGDSETLPSGKNGRGGRSIKDRIFADIPVSQAQCEKAWNHLCAFIYDNASRGHQEGPCWRPAPLVKLDVWKRMVEGAVLQDINLEKQFLVDDLWKALLDDDGIAEPEKGPFPRDLFDAVIRRVCESDQQGFDSGRKWASIDRATCVQWVGETYLEAMAPMEDSAIGRSEFLNAWKDHLPESWRDGVALTELPDGSYRCPDPTTIYYMDYSERQRAKKLPAEKNAVAAAKKTRNWHELFKNQRRR